MRTPLALAAVAAAFLAEPLSALGCPCQGSSGPGAAVTSRFQRVGASLTESARFVHGGWDARGRYGALASESRQTFLDFVLALGVRPVERLELGADIAFGRQSIAARGFSSQQTGFGDASFRARYEAVDEPMPFEKPFFLHPSLAVIGALRTPTGTLRQIDPDTGTGLTSGTTGTAGATASSQSLGAWEPAIAVELRQTEKAHYQISITGEAAYRLPDEALGFDRQLGPRLLGQLNFRYMPTRYAGLGALTDLGWEDAVSIGGERRRGTGQRLWTVGAYGYLTMPDAGLRSGIMIRYAPPLDSVSVNAIGATTLAVSLGYAR